MISLALAVAAASFQLVAARECDAGTRADILAPALDANEAVHLTCTLRLAAGDVVSKRLVLEGPAASGVTIDCGGGRIGRPEAQPSFPNPSIAIHSSARTLGGRTVWSPPSDIVLRNCVVEGPIRVWGMGLNGQGEAVKASSRSLGHTERAQRAAPTRITIDRSILHASSGTPLYLGPGVTAVSLTRSEVSGQTGAAAIYFDAESARNTIADTTFDIRTGREIVAVDGSAENRITGNRFRATWQGGIFLYRNCGEGGTIRHQTPSRNVITGNRFAYGLPAHLPAVLVGSREGWSRFCREDDGYPFGSSADDRDNATDNVVEGNTVEWRPFGG